MRKLIVVLALSVPLFAQSLDITGRVVDPAGAPVPNATIQVYMAHPRVGISAVCPSCYRDCGKRELTARTGEFRIPKVDDALVFRLLAVADGYEPAFAEKVDPRNGALKIELKRRPAGDAYVVRGKVIDPDGKLVVGATVVPQVVRQGARRGYGEIEGVDPLSITNDRGEFALRVPPETILDVRVRARNFAVKIEEKIAPNEPRTIQLGMGTTVVGRLESDGKPVAGAAVGFAQKSRWSETWMGDEEIGTDEEGRFIMTALPPGHEYFVYPKIEGLTPLAATPKIVCTATDGTSIDAGTFRLERGRRISGRVVVPGGAPVKGVKVSLSREQAVELIVVEADAEGRFAFDGVPREPVRISARAAGLAVAKESTHWSPPHRGIVFTPERDAELVIQMEAAKR